MKTTKELARELGLLRKRSSTTVDRMLKRIRQTKQLFSYLIVIDFESTCWENSKHQTQEIIEFPAVLLNTSTGKVDCEFHHYVQPQENPILSDFCKHLTGISQDQVELGIPLSLCLSKFNQWLRRISAERSLVFNCTSDPSRACCTFVTWSDWDLSVCLQYESRRKQLRKPAELNSWIDLRATYRTFYDRKPNGLNGALQDLGIEFEGREHSGLHDARNTAGLAWRMMCDGCVMQITKSLTSSVKARGTESRASAGVKSSALPIPWPSLLQQKPSTEFESTAKKKPGTCRETSVGDKLVVCAQVPTGTDTDGPVVPRSKQTGCAIDAVGSNVGQSRNNSLGRKQSGMPSSSERSVSADVELTSIVSASCNSSVESARSSGQSASRVAPDCTGSTSGQTMGVKIAPGGTSAGSHGATVHPRTSLPGRNLRSAIPQRSGLQISFSSVDDPGTRQKGPLYTSSAKFSILHDPDQGQPATSREKTVQLASVRVAHSKGMSDKTNTESATTDNKGKMIINPHFKTPLPPLRPLTSNNCAMSASKTSSTFKTPGYTQLKAGGGSSSGSSMLRTPPMCPCGRRSKRKVAQNPGPNMGRAFYCCPLGRGGAGSNKGKSGCSYFKWETSLDNGGISPGFSTTLRTPQAGEKPTGSSRWSTDVSPLAQPNFNTPQIQLRPPQHKLSTTRPLGSHCVVRPSLR